MLSKISWGVYLKTCIKLRKVKSAYDCVCQIYNTYNDLSYINKQLRLITARDISPVEIKAVILIEEYIKNNNLYEAIKILCHCEKYNKKIYLSRITRKNSVNGFNRDFQQIFNNKNNINKFNQYRQLLHSYGLGFGRKRSYVWKFIMDCIITKISYHLQDDLIASLALKRNVKNWGILSALDSLLYSFYYPEFIVDRTQSRDMEIDWIRANSFITDVDTIFVERQLPTQSLYDYLEEDSLINICNILSREGHISFEDIIYKQQFAKICKFHINFNAHVLDKISQFQKCMEKLSDYLSLEQPIPNNIIFNLEHDNDFLHERQFAKICKFHINFNAHVLDKISQFQKCMEKLSDYLSLEQPIPNNIIFNLEHDNDFLHERQFRFKQLKEKYNNSINIYYINPLSLSNELITKISWIEVENFFKNDCEAIIVERQLPQVTMFEEVDYIPINISKTIPKEGNISFENCIYGERYARVCKFHIDFKAETWVKINQFKKCIKQLSDYLKENQQQTKNIIFNLEFDSEYSNERLFRYKILAKTYEKNINVYYYCNI